MASPIAPVCEPVEVSEAPPGATVTVITNSNGPLSKTATLNDEGALVLGSSAHLTKGRFDVLSAGNVVELARIISSLTSRHALVHGEPQNGATSGVIVSEAKLLDNPGAITRSKRSFGYGNRPSWMMLDGDLKDFPFADHPGLDLSALGSTRAALCDAVPELASVQMLGIPSASAMIHRKSDGRLLRGLTGARFYVLVEHAAGIPELGKRLFDRLLLAGLGYSFVSKSGQRFTRSLIDASVWAPHRLDFIGGADCGPGVEQRRGEPQLWNAAEDLI